MDHKKLAAIVRAVQDHTPGADTQLYEAVSQELYYYILKTVNDPHLADDLLQDTFLDIYQNIGKLQAPEAFVSWSRQIAHSRCTDYGRKRHDLLVDEDEDGNSVFDTLPEDRTEFIPHTLETLWLRYYPEKETLSSSAMDMYKFVLTPAT